MRSRHPITTEDRKTMSDDLELQLVKILNDEKARREGKIKLRNMVRSALWVAARERELEKSEKALQDQLKTVPINV